MNRRGSRFPAAKCLRKGAKSSASKRPAVALDNIINNGAMMLIQKRVGKAKIFCFFPKEISSRQKNGCAFCVDKKLSNIFLLLLLLLLLLRTRRDAVSTTTSARALIAKHHVVFQTDPGGSHEESTGGIGDVAFLLGRRRLWGLERRGGVEHFLRPL